MDKKAASILKQLFNAVMDEIKQNEDFACKIEQILNVEAAVLKSKATSRKASGTARSSNRRDPAVLDPVALIIEDENLLIEKLKELDAKQLKDIIADYGMDPSKLAMRWRNQERLINHIVDTARRRASKGDAFRENTSNAG